MWDFDYMYPGFGNPPDSDPPAELDWEFWLGPSPKVPYNPNRYAQFYWFMDYAGAWQVDWAVHHYDIVLWALGNPVPVAATAMGSFYCFEPTNCEWPDTFSGTVEFAPGPVAKKGFLLQYTMRGGCRKEQRSHAKCFYGTEATMLLDRSGYTIYAEARGGRKLGEEIESRRQCLHRQRPHPKPAGPRRSLSRLHPHAQAASRRCRNRPRCYESRPPDEHRLAHRAPHPLGQRRGTGDRRSRGKCAGNQAVSRTLEVRCLDSLEDQKEKS